MFKNNIRYFKNLQKGLENSWRHNMFYSSQDKAQKDRFLFQNMIAAPFSTIQQDIVWNEVRNVFLKDEKMQMKNNRYVELVLLPEIFITIYQKFFSLDKQSAENYIKDFGNMANDKSPESSLLI